jgi:acetyl-CoA carboxylase biotin carboxyl carrier protein
MKGKKRRLGLSGAQGTGVDWKEVERVLTLMLEHGLEEFEYVRGELRVRLKKASGSSNSLSAHGAAAAANPSQLAAAGDPAVASATSPERAVAALGEELHMVKSPIVGTFYRAPSPGAEPFVKVGDPVEPGQALCIIEAMKLMNEIESDVAGEVVRIEIENGQPVEYGEPLFAIRPRQKK